MLTVAKILKIDVKLLAAKLAPSHKKMHFNCSYCFERYCEFNCMHGSFFSLHYQMRQIISSSHADEAKL